MDDVLKNKEILEQKWETGKESEKSFWSGVMSPGSIDAEFENGRTISDDLLWAFILNPKAGSDPGPLKVLDVGCGPISKVGSRWPGRPVELTCVDPLAETYNELLDKNCPGIKHRPIYGVGEKLKEQFGDETFDIVFSLNALDHSYNPLCAIKNMVSVTKDHGMTYFIVSEREADHWNYEGMHQWNFYTEKGRLMLSNRDTEPIDCNAEFDPEKYRMIVMNRDGLVYTEVRNFIHVVIQRISG
jgi:SAM-dependent methyltransferase